MDEPRRRGDRYSELLELLGGNDGVVLRRNDDRRRANARRIDTMEIAGQREREKTLGRPARREALTMMREIPLDLECRVVGQPLDRRRAETLGELSRAAIRRHRQPA